MIENQVFDLEKIKQLTSPIDNLQSKINYLNELSKRVIKKKQSFNKQLFNKEFLEQVEEIMNLLTNLNTQLIKISNNNIKRFLDFQDNLIKKYKENFKENLMKLELNEERTKKIGLFLIENKQVSRIINKTSFISSIELKKWLELIDSLRENSLFLDLINNVKSFYINLIQKKLRLELSKIPGDTDLLLLKEFEKLFLENPNLTFKKFLKDIKTQLTKEELKVKEKIIKKAKEKEELEKLKKKQEEQKETYEDYFKLSDTEFKRLRRKKKREKLSDIVLENEKEIKTIKISDEISEKIEKFKSKFEKRLKDDYMVQSNDNKDPIDLIRERKKRKEKEYKEFKDHFEEV
ncbi:MAG: hypothetical protein ACFE9T_03650 [Promethearchaeota archaeon]